MRLTRNSLLVQSLHFSYVRSAAAWPVILWAADCLRTQSTVLPSSKWYSRIYVFGSSQWRTSTAETDLTTGIALLPVKWAMVLSCSLWIAINPRMTHCHKNTSTKDSWQRACLLIIFNSYQFVKNDGSLHLLHLNCILLTLSNSCEIRVPRDNVPKIHCSCNYKSKIER